MEHSRRLSLLTVSVEGHRRIGGQGTTKKPEGQPGLMFKQHPLHPTPLLSHSCLCYSEMYNVWLDVFTSSPTGFRDRETVSLERERRGRRERESAGMYAWWQGGALRAGAPSICGTSDLLHGCCVLNSRTCDYTANHGVIFPAPGLRA